MQISAQHTDLRTAGDAEAVTVADMSDSDAKRTDDAEPAAQPEDRDLGDVEVAILAFEKKRWKHAGAKEATVRDEFGMSMTRYYQVLNALLDNPEALAADPLTVGRLRRLRAARQAERSGRRGRAQ